MTFAGILRDVSARLARLSEALADGEFELAGLIAEDLEHDLRHRAETLERRGAA